MASIRGIKKDLDYLVSEVLSDCYMALYFNSEENKRQAVVALIEEAVEFRNATIDKINHPAEKKNASLVKKHYAQIRRDIMERIDALFTNLSKICAESK